MKRKTKQVGTAVRKPAARTVSQTCAHLNALPTRRPIRSCVNTTFVLKATCSMRQICGDLGQVTYTAAAYTYGSPTADSMVDRGGPLPLRGAPSPICTQLRGVTQTTGTNKIGVTRMTGHCTSDSSRPLLRSHHSYPQAAARRCGMQPRAQEGCRSPIYASV